MKPAIKGGYRIYNHRHFPNDLHAKFVKLKKDTGKTIEFLIVAHLELAFEMGGESKLALKSGDNSIKKISRIENESSWDLARTMMKNDANISEDLCMPFDVVPIQEETI